MRSPCRRTCRCQTLRFLTILRGVALLGRGRVAHLGEYGPHGWSPERGDHDGEEGEFGGDCMPYTCQYSKPDRRQAVVLHRWLRAAHPIVSNSHPSQAFTRTDIRARLPSRHFRVSAEESLGIFTPPPSSAPFFLLLMRARRPVEHPPRPKRDGLSERVGDRVALLTISLGTESDSDSLVSEERRDSGGGRDKTLKK